MMSLSTHGDARRLGPACLCRRDEMGGTRDPGQVVRVLKGGAELTTELSSGGHRDRAQHHTCPAQSMSIKWVGKNHKLLKNFIKFHYSINL